MPTDRPSAKAVQNAKPQPRVYRLADGNGMFLEVRPGGKDGKGSKYWCMAYRFDGQQKLLRLAPSLVSGVDLPAMFVHGAALARYCKSQDQGIGVRTLQMREEMLVVATSVVRTTSGRLSSVQAFAELPAADELDVSTRECVPCLSHAAAPWCNKKASTGLQ